MLYQLTQHRVVHFLLLLASTSETVILVVIVVVFFIFVFPLLNTVLEKERKYSMELPASWELEKKKKVIRCEYI